MNKPFFNTFRLSWMIVPLLLLLIVTNCKEEEDPPAPEPNPIASFQFAISEDNFLLVNFSNFSQNATSYSWDFGDGNSSSEESPSHTYESAGNYTVTLTASNASGQSAQKSESVTLTDPNKQLSILAGTDSKTWYIQREGIALGIGPAMGDNAWWSFGGVTQLAERPCILDDSYTFHRDGTFEANTNETVFIDAEANGGWKAEEGCHDESEADVWTTPDGSNSDFANGGSYTFELNNEDNTLTLLGSGAYIGLPNKTENGDNYIPVSTKTYSIGKLAEGAVADSMFIALVGADFAWNFYLVSYHNPADLPEIPSDVVEFGEDYPDISPSELSNTFASADDFVLLDTIIPSGSTLVYGVNDPADSTAAKVGQFNRTDAQFQELQFQTSPEKSDINFENLTTVSLDVYLPSTNDYSGSLTTSVIIGVADKGATQQWWTDHYEYLNDGTDLPLDEWFTLTYNLDSPNSGARNPDGTGTPLDRTDLDMIYIQIGGGDHQDVGTFYVRNLKFE